MTAPSFIAGGNISPAVFVKVSTAADNTALQAGSDDLPIGISTPSQQNVPIPLNTDVYAADSGQPITVFGLGDICNLTAGTAGFNHGDLLKPDTNGCGTVASSNDYYGAVALETTPAAALGKVQVVIGKK